MYVKLIEQFPNDGVPELPVLKEGLFTIYSTLLEQLYIFFEVFFFFFFFFFFCAIFFI